MSQEKSDNNIIINEELDLTNDYSFISILILTNRLITKEQMPTFVNKVIDWESFRVDLNKKLLIEGSVEELDNEADRFIEDIQQTVWINTCEVK